MKKNSFNSDDFAFIKNKFENDGVNAPDALDEEFTMSALEASNKTRVRFKMSKSFKMIVSFAACFAIIIASITISNTVINNPDNEKITKEQTLSNSVLPSFDDYNAIKKYVKSSYNSNSFYSDEKKETAGGAVATDTATSDASFSQTYKQLENVDEADIIKTDGKYIYYVNSVKNEIIIYLANGKNVKKLSEITEFSYDGKASNYDFYINDMFLCDNLLVVNVTDTKEYISDTNVIVYDVKNPQKPVRKKTFAQSGSYISSRMTGTTVYIVTNKMIRSNSCKKFNDYVPYVEENGEKASIASNDICYVENSEQPSYLVISKINILSDSQDTQSKAILGIGENIYCNENNLYAYATVYGNQKANYDVEYYAPKTKIIKASIENNVEFTAVAQVDGYVNNQFSLDERNGFLRVATTSEDSALKYSNNLYVLDENLKTVGKIYGFAKDESVKAVRFINDVAYVITYEQTDPLFVIDLKNPKSPEIKGSVEISGFSTLLTPVDENTLLGIGYCDKETESGIVTNGMKLTLFDVSDCTNVKVLDSKELVGYDSEVLYNHKALVVNASEDYYAFPFSIYNEDSFLSGVVTFTAKNGKIEITNKFSVTRKDFYYSSRCVYINNYIYFVTSAGVVPFIVE